MEKIIFFFIKLYFKIVSAIAPKFASKQAIYLFQKPSRRAYKDNEIDFYNKAKYFTVNYKEEVLDAYEIGSENKKLVIIVHGWASNIGRLSKIAFRLEKEGYRVIGMNFPAHANSKLKQTNMVYAKNALVTLFKQLEIKDPFSIVTHSFGSGVSAFALAETQLKCEKIVFLTSANRIENIFLDFKKMVSLGEKTYQYVVAEMEKIVDFKLEKFNVVDILENVKYDKLLIIHDKFDKMLPYTNALEIKEKARDCELMSLENKGHSGMLFIEEVIEKVVDFLK
ncbi:MAG: alpha/beta fold hydrolase [Chitinophagales bacterium]